MDKAAEDKKKIVDFDVLEEDDEFEEFEAQSILTHMQCSFISLCRFCVCGWILDRTQPGMQLTKTKRMQHYGRTTGMMTLAKQMFSRSNCGQSSLSPPKQVQLCNFCSPCV